MIAQTVKAPPAPEAPPTIAQQTAQQLIADSDLALSRLAGSVDRGFTLLWGTPQHPRPRTEALDILRALPVNEVAEVFRRHAAIVTFLVSEGLVTVEPWQKVPAYPVTFEGGTVVLGEELSPEWGEDYTPPAEPLPEGVDLDPQPGQAN